MFYYIVNRTQHCQQVNVIITPLLNKHVVVSVSFVDVIYFVYSILQYCTAMCCDILHMRYY